MAHVLNKAADEILDKEFPILDKGFVRLVDYMGGDESVVQAARVSFGKGLKNSEKDKALIFYLMEKHHTSPFEMVELKFHCKMPIFVARQWIRHRTASVNEKSGRYSKMKQEFFIPEKEALRLQDTVNKQGRTQECLSKTTAEAVIDKKINLQKNASLDYEIFLNWDLAKEIARTDLPLSLYTEWYWKIDLHNFFNFTSRRMDSHAQEEIQVYARQMFEIAKFIKVSSGCNTPQLAANKIK